MKALTVKVCGMRDGDNIRAAETLDIDWIGLIFWPRSSRYVATPPTYLPAQARRVGVFVDEDMERVVRRAADYGLDLIQLHGSETAAYCQALRQSLADFGCYGRQGAIRIIKAFSIATAADLNAVYDYEGAADYLLFDTKGPSVGGNGTQFDWSVLSHYHGPTPFLLSGGIGPSDADRLRTFNHPQWMGIDLNSRFEQAPGLKDIEKIRTFIQQVRQL